MALAVSSARPTADSGDLQQLIADMARANRTWGQERIAAELVLKFGISVSSRTVRRYMRRPPSGYRGKQTQAWSTFLRNHARELLACDFFVTVTARFQLLFVFVVLDVGTRQIVHCNVTPHPTASWTIQQFRECVRCDSAHRYIVHDRDDIYSTDVDRALHAMGLHVLKTPARAPQAKRLLRTGDRDDPA